MDERGAIISGGGLYRWRLWRKWSTEPKVTFVMLNPSTADGEKDDPTIRRCVGFARRWGKGGIEVVNLFPYRATDPRSLVQADRVGLDIRERALRNYHVRESLHFSDLVVAAWGAHRLAVGEWSTLPLSPEHLRWVGLPALQCLAVTKSGAPRHPLYLRADLDPTPWSAR